MCSILSFYNKLSSTSQFYFIYTRTYIILSLTLLTILILELLSTNTPIAGRELVIGCIILPYQLAWWRYLQSSPHLLLCGPRTSSKPVASLVFYRSSQCIRSYISHSTCGYIGKINHHSMFKNTNESRTKRTRTDTNLGKFCPTDLIKLRLPMTSSPSSQTTMPNFYLVLHSHSAMSTVYANYTHFALTN